MGLHVRGGFTLPSPSALTPDQIGAKRLPTPSAITPDQIGAKRLPTPSALTLPSPKERV